VFFSLPCFCARVNAGAGAASLYVPRYIAEVAPPALRGWLGSMNQVGLQTWWWQQQQQQQQGNSGSSDVAAAATAAGCVGDCAAYVLGSAGQQERQRQRQYHQQHPHLTSACDWLGSMNQVGLLAWWQQQQQQQQQQ
jgi:hypothetical protein